LEITWHHEKLYMYLKKMSHVIMNHLSCIH
jgi:hypothetical protein